MKTRFLPLLLLAAACGTTDPTPVGIDLVNRSGGDVVEVADIPPVRAASRFREIFPSVLGEAGELLVGRMNGVEYVSLIEVALEPVDFPGGDPAALTVDSLFVELQIQGGLVRGTLGDVTVWVPDETWSETRAFVDTTDFRRAAFARQAIATAAPTRIDSTVRVALPTELLTEAVDEDAAAPVVTFGLSGGEGVADYLMVVGSSEADAAKVPQLVAHFAGGTTTRAGATADTYFADRVESPADGDVLIQTGVFSAGVVQFDLPTIPPSATVNLVELTMDFDFDRSFLSSLRLRIERIDVAGGDTTFTVASGNNLNEQTVTPVASPFRMNLDQLLFHSWMTGARENRGLIINPIFEIASDLRYEWGVFSNPRLRIVYSLPPPLGT